MATTVVPVAPSDFMVAITDPLAVEIVLGGIGDPDAADQQRGEADQREILREALDVALELRRGIVAVADFQAGLGERRIGGIDHRLGVGIARSRRRQAQPIGPAHQAAGLEQRGGAQRRLADDEARAESDAAGELVRLARERGAQLDGGGAERDVRAGREAQPLEQFRIDDAAEHVAAALQERRDIARQARSRTRP